MNLQKLIRKVEKRVIRGIEFDIVYGYTMDMIYNKIKNGSYVGNDLESFEKKKKRNKK